jgi:hypothetical protein
MEWNLRSRRRHADLAACSLCLRVHRGSAWVEAEDVIRELRSYELPAAPQLQPGICDSCADAILGRRARRGDDRRLRRPTGTERLRLPARTFASTVWA